MTDDELLERIAALDGPLSPIAEEALQVSKGESDE